MLSQLFGRNRPASPKIEVSVVVSDYETYTQEIQWFEVVATPVSDGGTWYLQYANPYVATELIEHCGAAVLEQDNNLLRVQVHSHKPEALKAKLEQAGWVVTIVNSGG